ncbi:MAG TPA: bifunctional phosphoribosylaminoimidazolecarboxamide formyltransferase/IMP cyclohydrolase [Vicinamibacterales bacterium]|nr:bifunctional phosphoribosylaminoimidazolecarboxamide formyltransferase/IMP cyclohydrolase [Vicinamibacterales bacterium]
MPRALLSVSDKTGLIPFATGLAARGFELVSTGGTARALTEAGLAVIPVAEVTGSPELMDGRVKTLHPRIHGGILARRSHTPDLEDARRHGIELIDLVAVNLYPFERAAANPDTPFDALLEEIDIGGPSMVRAAAKNFRDVLVVVSPADYTPVLETLDRPGGPSLEFRFELARKAFAHTAAYDAAIASTLEGLVIENGKPTRTSRVNVGPRRLVLAAPKIADLRYGENPHQPAAWFSTSAHGLGGAVVLQGKELSYTNLLDLDSAARIAAEFTEPAAVVIKHTNPCGTAIGATIAEAYLRARDADSLAAFGGIVGLNRPVDLATAEAIVSTFIEAVVAPGVDDEARAALAKKPNMRVVVARLGDLAAGGLEMRSVLGALLVQMRDVVPEAAGPWHEGLPGLKVVTERRPTPAEWEALRFAWRVCAHVKSNTVLFAGPDRTLAIGAGQMSRVDAVKVAVMKAAGANIDLRGSVAASDAFFPFRDGLDAVAAAGATAVVQPGGSMRDAEVIAAANEHGMAMVFTGRRHFRH